MTDFRRASTAAMALSQLLSGSPALGRASRHYTRTKRHCPRVGIVSDVVTRDRTWSEVKPLYGDTSGRTKAVEWRGSEAVVNALILASRRVPSSSSRP